MVKKRVYPPSEIIPKLKVLYPVIKNWKRQEEVGLFPSLRTKKGWMQVIGRLTNKSKSEQFRFYNRLTPLMRTPLFQLDLFMCLKLNRLRGDCSSVFMNSFVKEAADRNVEIRNKCSVAPTSKCNGWNLRNALEANFNSHNNLPTVVDLNSLKREGAALTSLLHI